MDSPQSPRAGISGGVDGGDDVAQPSRGYARVCALQACQRSFRHRQPNAKFCSAQCKREYEREVRRKGKASNMRPEDAERAERAEAALAWMEDQCGRAPSLVNIYGKWVRR